MTKLTGDKAERKKSENTVGKSEVVVEQIEYYDGRAICRLAAALLC